MAKRRTSKLVKFVKAVAKPKAKKNPEDSLSIPDLGIINDIGAAAAAYAATVLPAKIVGGRLLASGKPWGVHVQPLVSAGMLGLLWLLTSKVKSFRRYQTAALVGAGVALVHMIVKAWLPGMAPLLGQERQINIIDTRVAQPSRQLQAGDSDDGLGFLTDNEEMADPGSSLEYN